MSSTHTDTSLYQRRPGSEHFFYFKNTLYTIHYTGTGNGTGVVKESDAVKGTG